MNRRIAILTSGGNAPCLSTTIGLLVKEYVIADPEVEFVCYENGYLGLLTGKRLFLGEEEIHQIDNLFYFGGSPIGNSRIKLTNHKDLVARGLVRQSDDPLEVAAKRLQEDKVDILHIIGGDDTNTTAASLKVYLEENGYPLTVVGLPKTIDNDIVPIARSLGADTAADQACLFARNIIAENRISPRMLIIHEIMGRNCGWLAAMTALKYQRWLDDQYWNPGIGLSKDRWSIHALIIPEIKISLDDLATRLKSTMDTVGNVNIFLSEGAALDEILAELKKESKEVKTDAFGHVQLDTINPGEWFATRFSKLLGAQKVLVQKSGYFSRSAPSNLHDTSLIKSMVKLAVTQATNGISGVVGEDEEDNNQLKIIDFSRIKGGKKFDISQEWFTRLHEKINSY